MLVMGYGRGREGMLEWVFDDFLVGIPDVSSGRLEMTVSFRRVAARTGAN